MKFFINPAFSCFKISKNAPASKNANNENDNEIQGSKFEQEPDYEILIDDFNTFIDRFKTNCLSEYSKVEYIKKQLLGQINQTFPLGKQITRLP